MPVATAREAYDRAEGAVLVDVREDDEWRAGHTPDAVHIPMRQVAADTLPTGPPDLLHLPFRQPVRPGRRIARRRSHRRLQRGRRNDGLARRRTPGHHLMNGERVLAGGPAPFDHEQDPPIGTSGREATSLAGPPPTERSAHPVSGWARPDRARRAPRAHRHCSGGQRGPSAATMRTAISSSLGAIAGH